MMTTVASAAATGVSQYQAAQAKTTQYGYEADVNRKLASIAATNANYDIVSGAVKAQQAGLVSRAALGRANVRAGAANIGTTTGSPAAIRSSQIAVGVENQQIQRADAAHAAYGESVQAAEKTAAAGADVAGISNIQAALPIQEAGTVASAAGSVAGKWYQVSQLTPSGTSAPLDLLNPANTSGYGTVPAPTAQGQSSWNWNT